MKDIQAHKEYILAMAVNNHDQLYSAGRDGTLRFFKNPFKSNVNEVLMQVVTEDITALWVVDDLLFSGDDKGTVTKWLHNRNQVITIHSESHTKVSQYNIIEEVKSMIVENDILYTARDLDAVVTNITPGMMSCSTRAVIAGRAPLALVGPKVDGHRKFLVCITRDGKGITLIRNTKPFDIFWTKEVSIPLISLSYGGMMILIDCFFFRMHTNGSSTPFAPPKMQFTQPHSTVKSRSGQIWTLQQVQNWSEKLIPINV